MLVNETSGSSYGPPQLPTLPSLPTLVNRTAQTLIKAHIKRPPDENKEGDSKRVCLHKADTNPSLDSNFASREKVIGPENNSYSLDEVDAAPFPDFSNTSIVSPTTFFCDSPMPLPIFTNEINFPSNLSSNAVSSSSSSQPTQFPSSLPQPLVVLPSATKSTTILIESQDGANGIKSSGTLSKPASVTSPKKEIPSKSNSLSSTPQATSDIPKQFSANKISSPLPHDLPELIKPAEASQNPADKLPSPSITSSSSTLETPKEIISTSHQSSSKAPLAIASLIQNVVPKPAMPEPTSSSSTETLAPYPMSGMVSSYQPTSLPMSTDTLTSYQMNTTPSYFPTSFPLLKYPGPYQQIPILPPHGFAPGINSTPSMFPYYLPYSYMQFGLSNHYNQVPPMQGTISESSSSSSCLAPTSINNQISLSSSMAASIHLSSISRSSSQRVESISSASSSQSTLNQGLVTNSTASSTLSASSSSSETPHSSKSESTTSSVVPPPALVNVYHKIFSAIHNLEKQIEQIQTTLQKLDNDTVEEKESNQTSKAKKTSESSQKKKSKKKKRWN